MKRKNSLVYPLALFYFLGILIITPLNNENFFKKTEKLNLFKDEKSKIEIRVIDIVRKKGIKYTTTVKLLSNCDVPVEGYGIKLKFNIYQVKKEIRPGDVFRIYSKIRKFKNFKNPDGFDYVSMMRHKGIYGNIWAKQSQLEFISGDDSFYFKILNIRDKIREIIFSSIKDKRAAGILNAVITGDRTDIPKQLKENIINSGCAHLMAISGLHIGMVFFFGFYIARYLLSFSVFITERGYLRKTALGFAVLTALAYCLISGFLPSTKRAFILLLLGAAGFFMNKRTDPLNLLFSCGFFIVLFNPGSIFDPGFILSFSAVFSILMGFYLFPNFKKDEKSIFEGIKRFFSLLFKTSLFANSGTAPMVLFLFSNFPVFGLLTGLVMVPVFTFIILPFSFLGILLFKISPFLSDILFRTGEFWILFFINTANFVGSFNFASVYFKPSFLEVNLIFAWIILFFVFFKFKIDVLRKKRLFLALFSFVFFITLGDICYELDKRFEKRAKFLFFDVGKGNAALIFFSGGKTLLIDSGGFPGEYFDSGENIIAPFLLKNKIRTIDYAVVSHGHEDHYKGFLFLAEKFNIKHFIFNESVSGSAKFNFLKKYAKSHGIFLEPGKIKLKTGEIDFFQSNEIFENENDNSILTRVSIEGVDFLFTGDLAKKGLEQSASEDFIKDVDVFLIPHHGSTGSINKEFIENSSPEIAVISGGFRGCGKKHKIIGKIYENEGAEVFNINEKGAFAGFIKDGKLEIKNYANFNF